MATIKDQTPIYYEVRREGKWKIPNIKLPEPNTKFPEKDPVIANIETWNERVRRAGFFVKGND